MSDSGSGEMLTAFGKRRKMHYLCIEKSEGAHSLRTLAFAALNINNLQGFCMYI